MVTPTKVLKKWSLFEGDKVIWMILFFLGMISIIEVYSASSNMSYKTGYYWNPILQHADGLMGTGHGAPFCCKDGSWKYIFHAHWSKEKIHPRTSYFKDFAISDQGVVSISGEVIEPRVMK
mgnify:CR=1 FL=1